MNNIFACIPGSPERRRELTQQFGAECPEPTDLYTLKTCDACGESIWIGPRQFEEMNRRAALGVNVLLFDYECAIEYVNTQRIETVYVNELGGGDGVEGVRRT